MFYVFDSTGRIFGGSLEGLRRVEKTPTIRPERAVVGTSDFDNQSGAGQQVAYSVSSNNAKQYSDMLEQRGGQEIAYHAYQIMTQPAQCISSQWLLAQVAERFHAFPFQVFPIVDDRQQLVGLLSRRHFYEFLLSEDARLSIPSTSVAECFLTQGSGVYCADPVTDVRRIATLLVEKKLDAVPVVEDSGRLVGMVSRTDILKCAISDPPLSLWC